MSKKFFYLFFFILLLCSYLSCINYSISNSFNFKFTWPTNDYKTISSYFGYRIHPITFKESYHSGIDIAAPEGTDIYSICSGIVSLAEFNRCLWIFYYYL